MDHVVWWLCVLLTRLQMWFLWLLPVLWCWTWVPWEIYQKQTRFIHWFSVRTLPGAQYLLNRDNNKTLNFLWKSLSVCLSLCGLIQPVQDFGSWAFCVWFCFPEVKDTIEQHTEIPKSLWVVISFLQKLVNGHPPPPPWNLALQEFPIKTVNLLVLLVLLDSKLHLHIQAPPKSAYHSFLKTVQT